MLAVERLVVKYDELTALRGVSLTVESGALVAMIGSNGAGKTTLLNAVSGLIPTREGTISWEGSLITGLTPDAVCRLGIVQAPEGRKLFAKMTVEENLQMGAYSPGPRARVAESMKRVLELFPRLAERRRQTAESLSGGEQQMLALGRALMATPGLLMLDEPSLGLAPIMAAQIFEIIGDLNRAGTTILLVSQEVLQTLSIARDGYLLENGEITLAGPSERLLADQRVKKSYLGL